MKAFALTLLLVCAAASGVRAETSVSGFKPSYGTQPANPDQPDYRPADKPRPTYDFTFDISPDGEDGKPVEPRPDHHRPKGRH